MDPTQELPSKPGHANLRVRGLGHILEPNSSPVRSSGGGWVGMKLSSIKIPGSKCLSSAAAALGAPQ